MKPTGVLVDELTPLQQIVAARKARLRSHIQQALLPDRTAEIPPYGPEILVLMQQEGERLVRALAKEEA